MFSRRLSCQRATFTPPSVFFWSEESHRAVLKTPVIFAENELIPTIRFPVIAPVPLPIVTPLTRMSLLFESDHPVPVQRSVFPVEVAFGRDHPT